MYSAHIPILAVPRSLCSVHAVLTVRIYKDQVLLCTLDNIIPLTLLYWLCIAIGLTNITLLLRTALSLYLLLEIEHITGLYRYSKWLTNIATLLTAFSYA